VRLPAPSSGREDGKAASQPAGNLTFMTAIQSHPRCYRFFFFEQLPLLVPNSAPRARQETQSAWLSTPVLAKKASCGHDPPAWSALKVCPAEKSMGRSILFMCAQTPPMCVRAIISDGRGWLFVCP